MEVIQYNFDAFTEAFAKIKRAGQATPEDLNSIKLELNRMFSDSNCKEVLYTNNPDKMFFGIKIIPLIDADEIFDLLIDDEPVRVEKYIVEFDSHLFNPLSMLEPRELLAMLLHEVANLVGNAEPIMDARNDLNRYLVTTNEHIKVTASIHYKEILAYGLKDYMSKTRSMFYCADISDLYAQEFIAAYGLSEELASAYRKISHDNIRLYENINVSKFITFAWCLSIYKNMKTHRIGAIKTLERAMLLTGSRLEKMEMDNVIRRIKRVDNTVLMEAAGDKIRAKIREKMYKSRMNTLREIDNTFYELNMRVRNVEDEEDALYLMRQINSSIAILSEYANSADCTADEAARWNQVLDKFLELRDRLSKTTTYKNSEFSVFVKYPEIVENRY